MNGIGALFIDSNLATDSVHGAGNAFGLVTITVNGWHAVFHLLPGLLGIAVASRPRAALAYALGVGTMYIVVGSWAAVSRWELAWRDRRGLAGRRCSHI